MLTVDFICLAENGITNSTLTPANAMRLKISHEYRPTAFALIGSVIILAILSWVPVKLAYWKGGGDVRMATVVEKQTGWFVGTFFGQCFHEKDAVYCATEMPNDNGRSERAIGNEP